MGLAKNLFMKKKTIILIDDEKYITDLYSKKFLQEGFNVFTANNGRDGIKLIKIYKPDLILLDIVMPQCDGFTVLKEIKSETETKNIPVIVLTNLGSETDKKEAINLGAGDYVIKVNFTPAQMAEKIKAIIK